MLTNTRLTLAGSSASARAKMGPLCFRPRKGSAESLVSGTENCPHPYSEGPGGGAPTGLLEHAPGSPPASCETRVRGSPRVDMKDRIRFTVHFRHTPTSSRWSGKALADYDNTAGAKPIS